MTTIAAAYGLAFSGVNPSTYLLTRVPGWPVVEIERIVGSSPPPPADADAEGVAVRLTADDAMVWMGEYGHLVQQRDPARARFVTPVTIDDDEIAHPYLGLAASYHSAWLRRMTFHAGGVVVDGRAWAIVGSKQAGKSTALALLHLHGLPIVTDDILVLDERNRCFPGARSIDLRPDAASRLEERIALRPSRLGLRRRVRLDPLPPEPVPLAGWVFLGWGDETRVRTIPAAERLALLREHRVVLSSADDPLALLDLAALPMVEFSRPQDWRLADAATDRLVETLAR